MRRCLVNTLPRQEVPCKAVRFLIRESGFSGEEENAQPRPREVTVDLKEPVARWFDEMLASAQKESLYRQWNRSGMTGEFSHFLEECLASQMRRDRPEFLGFSVFNPCRTVSSWVRWTFPD